MQIIKSRLQPWMQAIDQSFATQLGWWFGSVLLFLLMVQGLLRVAGEFRRLSFGGEQRALARERLKLEIKAAQAKCREAEQQKLHWNGFRKFQVHRKQFECDNVYSFYLVPHDRKSLPPFKPGQYLTFQLQIPGQDKPLIRCYSLSD